MFGRAAAWSASKWMIPWADAVAGPSDTTYKAVAQGWWAAGSLVGSFLGALLCGWLGRSTRYLVISCDWQETEVVPPKLAVRRTGVPKIACPKVSECGVAATPWPEGLVEGHRDDTSAAAEIMVATYARVTSAPYPPGFRFF